MQKKLLITAALSLVTVTMATAQTTEFVNDTAIYGGLDFGADVIVGDLHGLHRWASIGGITAYSVGTVSCNIGDTPLLWIARTNEHPVIAQNMFRVKEGVFEQIGQSWLKHGFVALQQSLCQSCQAHPNGTALGVGCSDPYSAGLNGSQSGMGPKFEVNAFTGAYPYPPFQAPIVDALSRRVQVSNTDLDPVLNTGAVYFVEGQYVTPDDAAAGNQNNNSSYRRIRVSGSGGNFGISFISGHSTRREQVALYAWQEVDPGVEIQVVDVPGEGRFYVGSHVIDLGGGQWRYIYAIQNQTSDRSASSLTINFPDGTEITNVNFNDVSYHSGEPFDGTDWKIELTSSSLAWSSPQTHAQNQNANALRWGTVYTFWFDAKLGPTTQSAATIGLFKPGSPTSLNVTLPAPGCYADCDPNGVLDIFDFLCFQDSFVQGESYACDCDPNPVCDIFDFLCFQDAFV
ncbi:MAG: hypothetical protein IIC49_05110, partial [Planctomycetes bacterium]|nr:hypothetical protein [Planctomycetota bacterium]